MSNVLLSVIVDNKEGKLMRIFKSKWFHKWAEKEGLTDEALNIAIKEMEDDLVDADLGGHIYKKRAAIEGQGKSGGLRTILAFKVGNKAFFMFGFAKKQRANINEKELKTFKKMGKEYFGYSEIKLNKVVKVGNLIEVENNE